MKKRYILILTFSTAFIVGVPAVSVCFAKQHKQSLMEAPHETPTGESRQAKSSKKESRPERVDDKSSYVRENKLSFESRKFTEQRKGIYKIDITYPQLGASLNGAANFNRWVKEFVRKDAAGFRRAEARRLRKYGRPAHDMEEELDIAFEPVFSSTELVSLKLIETLMQLGQMHPIDYPISLNYDLKLGRRIDLKEVFKPQANYLQTISSYCFARLRKGSGQYNPENWIAEGTAPKAENYQHWNIARDGILISFDDYQVGPHSMGQPQILVPYDQLRNDLATNNVLPLLLAR
ncbi:MAG: RsiV family protein [Pyrinomonadaceae bacterium]